MTMTSRERVLAAVNHRQPDRVPIDLGGMKASGIAAEACHLVRQKLGMKGRVKLMDSRFVVAMLEEDIRRRFHLDVVPLDISAVSLAYAPENTWVPRRLFSGTEVLFPPGTKISVDKEGRWVLMNPDGTETSFIMPQGGHYFDDASFDRDPDSLTAANFAPVDTLPDATLELVARHAREVYEGTEYAMLGWGGGICFLGLSLITDRRSNVTMGQPSEWMVKLMTEKETCTEMMGRAVDASIKCMGLLHQAVGDRCFAWGVAADDSGTQRGEFLSPDLWAEMIKPHYRRLCDWIHAHTKWKTFLHSCGSVNNLIPHFIDAGIDILNPVQTSAANMDPVALKKTFGDRLVFWGGGCDTQTVLNKSTPAEVRQHVRDRIRTFSPGGGYVFNQVHNIQANVPPENIIAMLDAAYEFGAGE